MNAIFIAILIPSFIILCIFYPEKVVTCFSVSSAKSIDLCIKLLCVYCVWLGFTNLIKDSGLINKISKIFTPIIKKLFKTNNRQAINELSLNLTANMLGIGGVATPSAINSMQLLDKDNNEHGKNMLFVISSTSIQIIPITVISLMVEYGSENPYIVFIPTLITTTISTLLGVILCKVFK